MATIQTPAPYSAQTESPRSAVSWGAVFAGAVIAAAVSSMLLVGGTGLGFLSISPWQQEGASGTTLAVGTIIWLFLCQIIAYGIAGYVAGRLRTKWTDAAADEIYFRDTAHGFLVWALSAVVGFVLLGTTAASLVSGTAKTGAALAQAGAGTLGAVTERAGPTRGADEALAYFTDALLRPDNPANAGTLPAETRREVSRIMGRSLAQGEVTEQDQTYLVQIVAQRAGTDENTARQRITQAMDQAKQTAQQAETSIREAADAARKAAAALSLWAFASLLLGAFVASFSATLGGRARDK